MSTNTAKKLVSIAKAKVSKVKKFLDARDYKKQRKAVDIANPVVTGTVITLGSGAVTKMKQFDKLRVERDRIDAEMESIKVYFAQKAGTAEVAILGKTGKALIRGIKPVEGHWVKAQRQRQCTITKVPGEAQAKADASN